MPFNSTHHAKLYPQHGDRIVTTDSVTSLHPIDSACAVGRTCSAGAVVGDDAVDEALLDVGLDGDQVGAVVLAAADRRLAKLLRHTVDDVARPDAVQTRREVVRAEPRLHRR